MVFAELNFLYIFLPLNIILYFITKNKGFRNAVLIVFSLIFYAWGEPVWVCLLLFSSAMDYTVGRIIERNRGNHRAKIALLFSAIINLGILGVFKYSAFLFENINALLGISLPVPSFALPIGISFYTFQTLSYVIDVYRGNVKAQSSYPKYLMYLSLYTQLVAGPIVRYSDVALEIDNRQITVNDLFHGLNRFCVGLTKKVFVANVAGSLVDQFMGANLNNISVLGAWFGSAMFAIQIYFDFSGYSDMAIGLGRIFGFHFPENFNYPYIAKTATEFWRRWHITLSSFFRDYVYIPLGGNRKHQYWNLLVVWFLTGLWHGASWNFIFWGLFYFVFIAIERLFLKKWLEKLPGFISHIYMLFITLIAWTIFYFTDVNKLKGYLGIMFGFSGNPLTEISLSAAVFNNLFWIILAVLFCMPIVPLVKRVLLKYQDIEAKISTHYLMCLINLVQILVCTALLVGQSYNPFLYYRF